MSEAKRIVVLVKRFPRLSETFILNEFLELRRQGVPLSLYAIMDPLEPRSHPEALELLPEVSYLQTGRLWRGFPAALRSARRHPLGSLRALLWTITRHSRAAARNLVHALVLVDRLAGEGGVHVHAHFLHSPAAIAFIANKVSGQSYSLTGHAKDIYTTLPENLAIRCAEADFVTTCTAANRRHLVEEIGIPSEKVHLCRHGVDVDRFAGGGGGRSAGRVLSIGRLVPKKGHDALIRACGELARRGVGLELRIVGSGPLREELRRLASDVGIGEQVHFAGAMSQAEVIEELGRAQLFALFPAVMPDGDRDGIPNVLMEAMAAEVPVITTAVSGIPEILTDRVTARLVEPGRPDLLTDVLGELLSDPLQRERLGRAGRQFVLAECSWPRAVKPLQELLMAACGTPAPDPPVLTACRVTA